MPMQFTEEEIDEIFMALANSRKHLEREAEERRREEFPQVARNCEEVAARHSALREKIRLHYVNRGGR